MFCYSRNGLQLALLPRYSFDSRHKFLELINCHNRDKMAFETSEETIQEEEEDVGVRQSQNFAQQHFPQMASKARRKMITSVIRFGQIAPHYGKIFEVFGNFLKLFQYWAKFKTLHFYAIGPIVIAENGQILNKYSSHQVAVFTPVHKPQSKALPPIIVVIYGSLLSVGKGFSL